MVLPHLRPENKEEPEEFISVEREMAKKHRHTHPDYGSEDEYGNKDITTPSKEE